MMTTYLSKDEDLPRASIERIIGRELKQGDKVLFIDGNYHNLNRENLYITGEKGLLAAELSLNQHTFQLLKEGRIRFNTFTGQYELLKAPIRKIIVQRPIQPSVEQNLPAAKEENNSAPTNKEITVSIQRKKYSDIRTEVYLEINIA